ncbi:Ltp family lipoprotein [Novosphingobium guangzhouense]|uniref:Ltp family lipoprotein n=1 Tax=Novosphingobium guangzhouense TaxID=1850347 RepID=UPI001B80DF5C|nr:Ltp family lipoprotein [Novosphingobium guangzhouense]
MSENKKAGIGKKLGMGCLVVLGIFVGLGVLGAIVGDKDKDQSTPIASSSKPLEAQQANQIVGEPADSLTGPQRNAVRSATQYIELSGFSRRGLIDQLSSEYGAGFDVSDATIAVDSLNINWNEQAVRSAKSYLELSGFSCRGLIEQLMSDAGAQFSKSEATYGAQQAGAC